MPVDLRAAVWVGAELLVYYQSQRGRVLTPESWSTSMPPTARQDAPLCMHFGDDEAAGYMYRSLSSDDASQTFQSPCHPLFRQVTTIRVIWTVLVSAFVNFRHGASHFQLDSHA